MKFSTPFNGITKGSNSFPLKKCLMINKKNKNNFNTVVNFFIRASNCVQKRDEHMD